MALFSNGSAVNGPDGVLLFGGASSDGAVYNDTWQFNEGNLTWWNVTPYLHCTASSCPRGRFNAMMTWDVSDSVTVMFGGCSTLPQGWAGNTPGCPRVSQDILSDTWNYSDPNGGVGQWSLTVISGGGPPGRFSGGLASMCTLSGRCAGTGVLLFGGCGTTCPMGDTWSYSGGRWTELYPSVSPTARYGVAMGAAEGNYSVGAGSVVLFGGCTSSKAACNNGTDTTNGTWQFYSNDWHQALSSSQCKHAVALCPAARFLAGSTSYQGPGSPWVLEVFGGVGANNTVFGSTTSTGGGWWRYLAVGNPAGWMQTAVPLGLTSHQSFYPVGPAASRYDPMLVGTFLDGAVLFGGTSWSGSSLGDTWSNIPLKAVWILVNPPPLPSAEYDGSMVFDGQIDRAVLLGSCGAECGNETTWEYTATVGTSVTYPWGSLWPAVNSTNSPPGRFGASMVYFTASKDVVLFGGRLSNGSLVNDLWAFNGVGWSKQTLTGSSPSPRQDAAMVYDSSYNKSVLFGGFGASGLLGDTWTLTFNSNSTYTWNQKSVSPSPSARWGAAMSYDEALKEVVLFGGMGPSGPLGDTWTYSASIQTWAECTAASCTGANAPTPRWGASMVYDASSQSDILFGGCGSVCPLQDTWSFNGVSWTPLNLQPSPPPLYDAVMAYNSTGNYALLQGGISSGGVVSGLSWILSGGKWSPLLASNPYPDPNQPGPRIGMALAYNSTGNYVLLVGGCQNLGEGSCGTLSEGLDTWEFANGSWVPVCVACGPAGRWYPALVFDAAEDSFMMVGGCKASSPACTAGSVLDDAWKFGDGRWTQLTTPPFQGRGEASMAYDAHDQAVVLFGGIGCGSVCADTWVYRAGGWSMVSGSTSPSPRYGAAMVYDGNASVDKVVLAGGAGAGGNPLNDFWYFSVVSGWALGGSSSPWSGRWGAAMTYDPVTGAILMGGGLGLGGTPRSGMWELKGGLWSRIGSLPMGVGRWGLGLTYDPDAGVAGYLLMFGGSLASSTSLATTGQGDTWSMSGLGLPGALVGWTDITLVA